MPKSKKVTKVDGHTVRSKNPMRLRIGTRKTGKSAVQMSTPELQAVLEENDKRKGCAMQTELDKP